MALTPQQKLAIDYERKRRNTIEAERARRRSASATDTVMLEPPTGRGNTLLQPTASVAESTAQAQPSRIPEVQPESRLSLLAEAAGRTIQGETVRPKESIGTLESLERSAFQGLTGLPTGEPRYVGNEQGPQPLLSQQYPIATTAGGLAGFGAGIAPIGAATGAGIKAAGLVSKGITGRTLKTALDFGLLNLAQSGVREVSGVPQTGKDVAVGAVESAAQGAAFGLSGGLASKIPMKGIAKSAVELAAESGTFLGIGEAFAAIHGEPRTTQDRIIDAAIPVVFRVPRGIAFVQKKISEAKFADRDLTKEDVNEIVTEAIKQEPEVAKVVDEVLKENREEVVKSTAGVEPSPEVAAMNARLRSAEGINPTKQLKSLSEAFPNAIGIKDFFTATGFRNNEILKKAYDDFLNYKSDGITPGEYWESWAKERLGIFKELDAKQSPEAPAPEVVPVEPPKVTPPVQAAKSLDTFKAAFQANLAKNPDAIGKLSTDEARNKRVAVIHKTHPEFTRETLDSWIDEVKPKETADAVQGKTEAAPIEQGNPIEIDVTRYSFDKNSDENPLRGATHYFATNNPLRKSELDKYTSGKEGLGGKYLIQGTVSLKNPLIDYSYDTSATGLSTHRMYKKIYGKKAYDELVEEVTQAKRIIGDFNPKYEKSEYKKEIRLINELFQNYPIFDESITDQFLERFIKTKESWYRFADALFEYVANRTISSEGYDGVVAINKKTNKILEVVNISGELIGKQEKPITQVAEAAPETKGEISAKLESWQMTPDEYTKSGRSRSGALAEHRNIVKQALKDGKPVSEKILLGHKGIVDEVAKELEVEKTTKQAVAEAQADPYANINVELTKEEFSQGRPVQEINGLWVRTEPTTKTQLIKKFTVYDPAGKHPMHMGTNTATNLKKAGIDVAPEKLGKALLKPKTETQPTAQKQAWEMTRDEYILENQVRVYNEPVDYSSINKARERYEAKPTKTNERLYKEEQRKFEAGINNRDELSQQTPPEWFSLGYGTEHRTSVFNALQEGKPVPAEVLRDYPDLAAKYGKGADKSKLGANLMKKAGAEKKGESKKRGSDEYLNEVVDYGGIPTKRGDVIADLQKMGRSQKQIDAYLQGMEARKTKSPIVIISKSETASIPIVESRGILEFGDGGLASQGFRAKDMVSSGKTGIHRKWTKGRISVEVNDYGVVIHTPEKGVNNQTYSFDKRHERESASEEDQLPFVIMGGVPIKQGVRAFKGVATNVVAPTARALVTMGGKVSDKTLGSTEGRLKRTPQGTELLGKIWNAATKGREMSGRWFALCKNELHALDRKDKRFCLGFDDVVKGRYNFMALIENLDNPQLRAKAPAKVLAFADAFKRVTDTEYNDAHERGIRVWRFGNLAEISEGGTGVSKAKTDKWGVKAIENRTKKIRWLTQQIEKDPADFVSVFEKMKLEKEVEKIKLEKEKNWGWGMFPIRKIEKYFPHHVTDKFVEACRKQEGPVWDALLTWLIKTTNFDLARYNMIVESYRTFAKIGARHVGSLESPRLAVIPDFVVVNGKRVSMLDGNPFSALNDMMKNNARRLGIVEEFGQNGSEFERYYNEIAKTDPRLAEDMRNIIFPRMQGAPLQGINKYGFYKNYARPTLSWASSWLLSASALAQTTGLFPVATQYGIRSTARAMADVMRSTVRKGEMRKIEELGGYLGDTLSAIGEADFFDVAQKKAGATVVQKAVTGIQQAPYTVLRHTTGKLDHLINTIARLAAVRDFEYSIKAIARNDKGHLKKMWGSDADSRRRMLRDYYGFTDKQIDDMISRAGRLTKLEKARIVQRASARVNASGEYVTDLPPVMHYELMKHLHPFARFSIAQSRHTAWSLKEALKHGNVKPLLKQIGITGLAAGALEEFVRNFARDKQREDDDWAEYIYNSLIKSQIFGVVGRYAEDIQSMVTYNGEPSDTFIPAYISVADNAYSALRGVIVEESLIPLYRKGLLKNIPAAKILDIWGKRAVMGDRKYAAYRLVEENMVKYGDKKNKTVVPKLARFNTASMLINRADKKLLKGLYKQKVKKEAERRAETAKENRKKEIEKRTENR